MAKTSFYAHLYIEYSVSRPPKNDTMPTQGALVVFGSGPGVGRNVAALFAERGFEKIILLSRDGTRLAQDAEFVRNACSNAATTHEITVDLANTDSVRQCLPKIEASLQGTPLRCVLFNAARTGKSEFFQFEPESLESDLRVLLFLSSSSQYYELMCLRSP